MLHYLYLDYGGLPKYRRELRYSLISLRSALGPDPADAKIVVYTDAPTVYARWPVEVVDIAGAGGRLVAGRALPPPHQAGGGAGRSDPL